MDRILRVIFMMNGYVFGGYVRDTIAGLVPSDVDCYMPVGNMWTFLKLLVNSSSNGITVMKTDKYAAGYYGCNHFMRLIVHDGGLNIQVDVVDSPLFMPDFDVNMLRMTSSGINVMTNMVSLPEVLKNIGKMQAKPLTTCVISRKLKMRRKGWKIIKDNDYGYTAHIQQWKVE